MILQAYDFVELHKRTGCVLQMGGSDQWGNIVNGIDLGRRMMNAQLFALTAPLITTVVGRQDGQDRGRRRVAQPRHGQPLRVLAVLAQYRGRRRRALSQAVHHAAARRDRPAGGVARPGAQRGQEGARHRRRPRWCTAAQAAEQAAETARRTFEEGALAETLPTVEVPRAELANGIGVLNAAMRAGLVASTSDARRQIKGGGLKVNDATVTDEKMVLTRNDLAEGVIKLSLGRKRHVLLKPV